MNGQTSDAMLEAPVILTTFNSFDFLKKLFENQTWYEYVSRQIRVLRVITSGDMSLSYHWKFAWVFEVCVCVCVCVFTVKAESCSTGMCVCVCVCVFMTANLWAGVVFEHTHTHSKSPKSCCLWMMHDASVGTSLTLSWRAFEPNTHRDFSFKLFSAQMK